MKNPGKYKSVSAFAPITNPINCPWGKKAFTGYFGEENVDKWKEHDATELLKKWKGPLDVLIDVVCSIIYIYMTCIIQTTNQLQLIGNWRQLLQTGSTSP